MGQGLDVVDDGVLPSVAALTWVRRLRPGPGGLRLEDVEDRRLLASDVDVVLEAEPDRDERAQKVGGTQRANGVGERSLGGFELAVDVDDHLVGFHRPRGHEDALEYLVRGTSHEMAVLVGAGLPLGPVDHEVSRRGPAARPPPPAPRAGGAGGRAPRPPPPQGGGGTPPPPPA